MKELRGKAREVIRRLVETTDSVSKILKDAGVGRTTYYGARGWIKDPVFLEKLQEERRLFESELRGQFTSKRRRIEELERIYKATPKTGNEYWHNGTTKRVWRNDAERRACLDQIRKELEGDSLFGTGPGPDVQDKDLVDRRRKAAADLEAWRKEQREKANAADGQ